MIRQQHFKEGNSFALCFAVSVERRYFLRKALDQARGRAQLLLQMAASPLKLSRPPRVGR